MKGGGHNVVVVVAYDLLGTRKDDPAVYRISLGWGIVDGLASCEGLVGGSLGGAVGVAGVAVVDGVGGGVVDGVGFVETIALAEGELRPNVVVGLRGRLVFVGGMDAVVGGGAAVVVGYGGGGGVAAAGDEDGDDYGYGASE